MHTPQLPAVSRFQPKQTGTSSLLRNAVVVITGASSGIGRATARAFAEQGARLVLAARNESALRDTAGECAMLGAHSLVLPTDVTDPIAMTDLARKTVEAFGRIDIWINNAGVGLFGPFVKASIDEHRRVVEIDLLGAMNGAAAVLPWFLRQHRGVMISTVSIGGMLPVPFAAAYTAAKFGLRGFLAALRQELAEEPQIRICGIFPAEVDTPGFAHGANVSGVELRPAWPIFPPEAVANAMVRTALHPRDEVPVGWPTRLVRIGYGVAPRTSERITGAVFRRFMKNAPKAGRRDGNLFEPSSGRMTARGGWSGENSSGGLGRTLAIAGVAGLAGIVTAVAANAWMRRRMTHPPAVH